MNTAKNALVGSINVAKEAANPEAIRAGLSTAVEKAKELAAGAPAAAGQTAEWARANPGTATCAVVGAVGGIVMIAAPMAVAGPAMAAGGLIPTGPVAGTLATTIQAAIGNVAGGSAFAVTQSAAAGGAGAATVAAAVQGIGTVIVAGTAATVAWKTEKSKHKYGSAGPSGPLAVNPKAHL